MYDVIGWVMVVLSIVACIISAHWRHWSCMIIYIITSAWWFYYNYFVIDEIHQGLLRLFYFGMAIYGIKSWRDKDKIKEKEK